MRFLLCMLSAIAWEAIASTYTASPSTSDYVEIADRLASSCEEDRYTRVRNRQLRNAAVEAVDRIASSHGLGQSISERHSTFRLPSLEPRRRLQAVGTIMQTLGSYRPAYPRQEQETGGPSSHRSSYGTASRSVGGDLDRVKTTFGKLVLASMEASPPNPSDSEKVQRFADALHERPELRDRLERDLEEVAALEEELLKIWATDRSLQSAVDKVLGKSDSLPWNSIRINGREALRAISSIVLAASPICWGVATYLLSRPRKYPARVREYISDGPDSDSLFGRVGWAVSASGRHMTANPRNTILAAVVAGALAGVTYLGLDTLVWKPARERRRLYRIIHRYVIAAAKTVQALSRMQQTIATDIPAAAQVLKHFDLIQRRQMLAETSDQSMDEILRTFRDKPGRFTGRGSYWTVKIACVVRVYRLLQECREDFARIFEAIGEIDAYLSGSRNASQADETGAPKSPNHAS